MIPVIRKFFLLATVLGITLLALDIGGRTPFVSPMAGASLAFGFLLLFAFLVGRLSRKVGTPMITGFLVAGALAGPYGLDIVTPERAAPLKLIDTVALALIAMTAGGELKMDKLRKNIRALFFTATAQTLVTFMLVFFTILPALAAISFLDGAAPLVVGALILGVIATANSPATAIAVITETRSRGPVSDTIIGVTVIKDVMVILLFGFAVALSEALLATGASAGFSFLGHVAWEMAASIGLGLILGGAVIIYLEAGYKNAPLFILAMAVLVAELCQVWTLSPLITAVTIGALVENLSQEGERLIEGLQTSSLPVFVVFFSLTGQGIDFGSLAATWPVALFLVAVRMVGTRQGALLGLEKAGAPEALARHAWTGFIGQAGVSLGFATMVATRFPGVGEKLATLVVATVAINQLVGPVMMKWSLGRAGEIGKVEEKKNGASA